MNYVFYIDPGPLVNVRVQGARLRQAQLKKYIPVYEENAVDDDLLNEGRRNLRDYFQTQGYFDAEVTVRKDFDQPTNTLDVVYIVEKGIRHHVAGVFITGNRYFPEDIIRERMQVQSAGRLSHGLYSQSLLNRDVQSIKELYQSNGFEQVKVSSSVQDDYQGQKGRLAVTVQIEEGPQTLVAELHIAGNRTIPTDELLPLLTNAPGQPFSDSNVAAPQCPKCHQPMRLIERFTAEELNTAERKKSICNDSVRPSHYQAVAILDTS